MEEIKITIAKKQKELEQMERKFRTVEIAHQTVLTEINIYTEKCNNVKKKIEQLTATEMYWKKKYQTIKKNIYYLAWCLMKADVITETQKKVIEKYSVTCDQTDDNFYIPETENELDVLIKKEEELKAQCAELESDISFFNNEMCFKINN